MMPTTDINALIGGNMDFKEAINERADSKAGDFCIYYFYEENRSFRVSGYLSRDGKSIYAHYPAMNLTAGSQTDDAEKATIKAICRLLNLIEYKLIAHKLDESYDNIFFNEVDEEEKRIIVEYSRNLVVPDHFHDPEHIAVFTENIEKRGRAFIYSRRLKGKVDDLEQIQDEKCEMLEQESEEILLMTLPDPEMLKTAGCSDMEVYSLARR